MSDKQKNKKSMKKVIVAEIALLVVLVAVFISVNVSQRRSKENNENSNAIMGALDGNSGEHSGSTKEQEEELLKKQKEEAEKLEKQKEEERVLEEEQQLETMRQETLVKAQSLATVYDYDAAIELLQGVEGYEEVTEYTNAIADYEEQKAECVPFGAYNSSLEVSHIFFHSLIVDTTKSFDGDYQANGYNYYMTTVEEFIEMMNQMYDQGYVLVSIHDVATQVVLEDGTITYQDGDIMLPPDKKPFVLSQDDVNYYEYMVGDGFASRMILDENGKPTTEMILDDGSTVIGDFDMVPILETFLETHPDFSYKGARGILALTGYEGALGYRTDPASKDSPTYEEDKETVRQIADTMKELGWEFACHSNGHRDLYKCTDEFLEYDTSQWLEYVGSLVGETDIYIYPFGIEIENTLGPYTNKKYKTLYQAGFRYFCNVDSRPWIQVRQDYVRMGRRPLDGQAMLMFPERLADLFDLSKIIDPTRPELK